MGNETKGIKLESDEYRIEYADDLTAFLSDIKSVQNLFKLLDRFEKNIRTKRELYVQKHKQYGLVRVVIKVK